MKILFVCGPKAKLKEPFRGGTEVFVHNLATELCSNKDIEATCLVGEADLMNSYAIELYKKTIFDLSDRMSSQEEANTLFSAMSILKFDLQSYDIVHYNCFDPNVFKYAKLVDHNAIVTLHIPPNKKQVESYIDFKNSNLNTTFVAVSKKLKKQWQEFLGDHIEVIENGVSVNKTGALNHQPLAPSLLWVGRICEEKQPDKVIKLVKKLGLNLNIVGPVFNLSYFENKVKPLLDEKIQYKGELIQSELANLYRISQALVVATKWEEPFGLSIAEALTSGLPVVLTENSFGSEKRNCCGLIYSKLENSNDLLNALHIASRTDRLLIREQAKIFSLTRMGQEYLNLYDVVIKSYKKGCTFYA